MMEKSLIEDDVYVNLRAHFLRSGKGRPKALKQGIPINNRLLVQLHWLRKEGSKPWTVIEEWLTRISPDVQKIEAAETHFSNLAESVAKKCSQLNSEALNDFLNSPIDLDFISESLSEVGIFRSTFTNPPSALSSPAVCLTHNVVVDLEHYRRSQRLAKKYMYLWLHMLGGHEEKRLPYSVDSTLKKYDVFRHKQPEELSAFLKRSFTLPHHETSQPVSSLPSSSLKPPPQLSVTRPKKCTDCVDLISEKSALLDLIKTLQGERCALQKQLRQTEEKFSKFQLAMSRKEKTKERQLDSMKSKLRKTVIILKQCNSELRKELDFKINECTEATSLEKINKRQIRKLQREKDDLSSLWNSMKENMGGWDVSLKRGDKNAYTDDVRIAVISLMTIAGVSATNVGKVFNIVANNIFHFQFKEDLPCMYTCLKMVDEGYVISQIHAAESVLKASNATLHCDGTSRDHKKVVSHQLSTNMGDTLYLGFVPIACEDASSLLEISLGVLKDLALSYQEFSDLSFDDLRHEMMRKITSLMSDRAASMKLWGKKIEEHFNCELDDDDVKLNLLHCNAHFLLGLSSACEKALSSFESKVKDPLGRDQDKSLSLFNKNGETSTGRAIRLTCDVLGPRGDQKNGCREDWITFVAESLIPSFRSNRFNCFFEAAAAIIFHRESIVKFFTSGVLPENINTKLKSVSLDVQDERLMSLLSAVALFFLKISGPYWKLVNSHVKYNDFHVYVKRMYEFFKSATAKPELLMDPSIKSVFSGDDDIYIVLILLC